MALRSVVIFVLLFLSYMAFSETVRLADIQQACGPEVVDWIKLPESARLLDHHVARLLRAPSVKSKSDLCLQVIESFLYPSLLNSDAVPPVVAIPNSLPSLVEPPPPPIFELDIPLTENALLNDNHISSVLQLVRIQAQEAHPAKLGLTLSITSRFEPSSFTDNQASVRRSFTPLALNQTIHFALALGQIRGVFVKGFRFHDIELRELDDRVNSRFVRYARFLTSLTVERCFVADSWAHVLGWILHESKLLEKVVLKQIRFGSEIGGPRLLLGLAQTMGPLERLEIAGFEDNRMGAMVARTAVELMGIKTTLRLVDIRRNGLLASEKQAVVARRTRAELLV